MVEVNRTEPVLDAGTVLMNELRHRLPSGVRADDAVRAIMCTFSQHVSGAEARRVLEALPQRLHSLLDRCMLHREEKAESFDREQLVVRVADHLGVSLEEADAITSAVLEVVSARLPAKEVNAVAKELPPDLRELWMVRPVVEPHPIFLAIEESAALPGEIDGATAMARVMGTLSRRLALGEARRLEESLPHEVSPLLEPYTTAREEQAERFGRDAFLAQLARDLRIDDAEAVARVVFRAVQRFLGLEVIEEVKGQLPTELGELWAAP